MKAKLFFKKYPKVDFAVNTFDSNKDVIKYINRLEKLGAKVDIPCCDDYVYKDHDYFDEMIVTMPKSISKKFDVAVFILDEHSNVGCSVDETSTISGGKVNWKTTPEISLWWD
ncbi:hypothetical protein UFOVP1290_461 [uncultured Caudovirales phage]|uniref:Uncharacterized protein n=1 Tax=uncultured Caudovirales phage TaxID=2100421 RepID=A0A6J5RTP9_9CAUD|nr:hypothetical protein UFOVP1290_461 [uncultured Caudovirales phage]